MAEQPEFLPLDEPRLGSNSARFAAAIFAAAPQVRKFARMFDGAEPDGLSLDLDIPSPTGDNPGRLIEIWVGNDPSIFFGPGHTHSSLFDDEITGFVDLLCAILADRLLIIEDVGGKYPGGWIDLREPDALLDELTSRWSPGCARLKSWSGKADRCIDLDGLAGEQL